MNRLDKISDFSTEIVPIRIGWPRCMERRCTSFEQRSVFAVLRLVDGIRQVLADHRHVGRDADDIEIVDRPEFLFFGQGRTGHAGKLFVHAEIILEGDRRQGLVLLFDLDAFLGFDRLVQTVAVATSEHQAAGEIVDDDDLAVLDHIFLVAMHRAMRLQGIVDVVVELVVFLVGQVLHLEILLGLADAARRQDRRLRAFSSTI